MKAKPVGSVSMGAGAGRTCGMFQNVSDAQATLVRAMPKTQGRFPKAANPHHDKQEPRARPETETQPG